MEKSSEILEGNACLTDLVDTGASFIFTMIAKDVKKALGDEKPAVEPKLNDRQERALTFLKKHGTITVANYLTLNPEITRRTAHSDLIDLVKRKVARAKGSKKGRRYILWEP